MNKEPDNPKHESDSHSADPSDQSWLERNVNLVIIGLVIACVLTLVAEWQLGPFFDEKHPAHFPQEEWFGIQAAFGFVAFVVVVFLGTMLRKLIMREEGYYDDV